MVSSSIDPIKVLKKGSFTYNQVKNIANLNKIKGLRVFEIDGSIELEHTLGVSGSIEYALAIWNGDSKEVALEKAIIRAIKIHGVNFVKSLKLDEKYESIYDKLAKLGSIAENQLYIIKYCKIQDEIFIHVGISIFIMILFYILSIKLVKAISYNYIKNTNGSIIDMFNDELEYYSYNNLLTEDENNIIVENITKGEISKLIVEIKGSVNKKISINKVISKETEFILESRRNIFLPNDNEIKEITESLIKKYFNKVNV